MAGKKRRDELKTADYAILTLLCLEDAGVFQSSTTSISITGLSWSFGKKDDPANEGGQIPDGAVCVSITGFLPYE